MNVVVQHNEVIHIAMHEPKLDLADQEMAIALLTQMVDVNYEGAELTIQRNKYGTVTDISIRFSDIEDATHFKLTHMWQEQGL